MIAGKWTKKDMKIWEDKLTSRLTTECSRLNSERKRREENAHMLRTRSITTETITSWASSYLAYKE